MSAAPRLCFSHALLSQPSKQHQYSPRWMKYITLSATMSLQISCGAGTPDSASERARQTAMTIFDWTYDPVNRPYHGAPNNKVPYRRPEGFPGRLVAIGALGGYMGGFFLPVGDMMLSKLNPKKIR